MSQAHPDKRATQTWNHNVSVPLKCSMSLCSAEYADVKGLVSHLSHIQDGLTVTCPYDGCSKTFNVKTSFSSHISRYHRRWDVTQIAPVHLCEVAEQSSPGEGAHDVDSVPDEIDAINTDQSENEVQDAYTNSLAQFFLGLQAKQLVPASTITEIAN